jgi:Flp pilus assembly protein TadD
VLEVACASSSEPLDHFHLGELLAVELERPREGIPHLRRACELAPDNSQPFTSLGIALSMVGDWPGAVSGFESACTLAPHDVGAWANLAQGYSKLGDETGMIRAASRAQELESGEPISSALLSSAKSAPPSNGQA